MATEQAWVTRTYAAPSDYSSYQYFLMKHGATAGQVAIVAAATDRPIGLLQNKPAAAGRAAEVMALGWSKANVEATTDIAIGDALGPHTDGRLITKMPLADNAVVCAMAEQAATSATGDIITVMIFPPSWVSVA
jgi:hypothetical protein